MKFGDSALVFNGLFRSKIAGYEVYDFGCKGVGFMVQGQGLRVHGLGMYPPINIRLEGTPAATAASTNVAMYADESSVEGRGCRGFGLEE